MGANLICACWGPLAEGQYEHMSCDVIVRNPDQCFKPFVPSTLPCVCKCECQTCKRAWWVQGRPIIREEDGVVRRSFE